MEDKKPEKWKLSRKDWHYTYLQWAYNKDFKFKSICPYFWFVVMSLGFAPLFVLAKILKVPAFATGRGLASLANSKGAEYIGMGFIVCFLLCVFALLGFSLYTDWLRTLAFVGALILGVGLGVLGIATLVKFGESDFVDRMASKFSNFFWFFLNYAKAAKDKVCPMIEWDDEVFENVSLKS